MNLSGPEDVRGRKDRIGKGKGAPSLLWKQPFTSIDISGAIILCCGTRGSSLSAVEWPAASLAFTQ